MSYQTPIHTVKTTNDWSQERLAALHLACVVDVGSRGLHRKNTAATLTEHQQSCIAAASFHDTKRMADALDAAAIRFVLPHDAEYPAKLRASGDPPGCLFIRGAPLRNEARVAMVGTRKMTSYGKRCAELIAGEIGRARISVVSGLALGIDAAAHIHCLDAGGHAIAILPGGVDDASIAPKTNARLAKRILENGGTLVSEQPPHAATPAYQFLFRNRIIAWISDAVIVIEADRDSGSLVTARLALEEGREVLAVPGPIWSPTSRGTNELIKHGARPCLGAEDVYAALGYGNETRAKQIAEARTSLPVSADEERVLAELYEPRSVDELSRRLTMTAAQMSVLLSMLEMKGRIVSTGPRTFLRN